MDWCIEPEFQSTAVVLLVWGHFLKLLSQSSWRVAVVASYKLWKKKKLDLNSCWQFLRVNLLNSDSCFLSLKQLIYHRWGLCFGYTLKENLLLTKTVHQVLPDTLYFPPLSGHDFDICSCPIIGLEQLLTGFWKTVPLRKTLPHVNHLHTRNINIKPWFK